MTSTMVLATTRSALVSAHAELAEHVARQRDATVAEHAEVQAACALATDRHWATSPIKRRLARLERHLTFLDKVAGAIRAGYSIVPNFDLDLLAVRIRQAGRYGWHRVNDRPTVGAERLPIGEGEYVSPEPEFESWREDRLDASGKKIGTNVIFRSTKDAPVAVPFVLLKRELADALHAAMTERLFDEIGVVNDARTRKRADPVLVGRVLHPNVRPGDRRGLCFFIGWWFDRRVLEL